MDSNDRLTWGETVEAILQKTGWTGAMLAARCGVTEGMVSKWRRSRNSPGGAAQVLLLTLYEEWVSAVS